MRFRQIHLDFHTSPLIPGIGSRFDAKAFAQAFKDAYVDSVTVFSKCHHGVSYHPTSVGKMHPHLEFDLLRAQIDALHAVGINAPVYLTATWDELAAFEHPEWRTVSPGRHPADVPPRARQRRRLGLPRLLDPLSRLPLRPDRGGDAHLPRRRRDLHGHLVPAPLDLLVGQDQDGGAGARLDRRARPRDLHRAIGGELLHPRPRRRAQARPEDAALLQLRPHAPRPAQALRRLLHPPRARNRCRPPAGATSTSRSAPATSIRSASPSSA